MTSCVIQYCTNAELVHQPHSLQKHFQQLAAAVALLLSSQVLICFENVLLCGCIAKISFWRLDFALLTLRLKDTCSNHVSLRHKDKSTNAKH